jgi:YidC/Oxa1 family membrane protein insertase
MDMRRFVLFAMLALVSYSLVTAWRVDYPERTARPSVTQKTLAADLLPANPTSNVPQGPDETSDRVNLPATAVMSSLIHIKTDVLDLHVDLARGDIVQANLLDYPVSLDQQDKPFKLLMDDANSRYVANSGLFTVSGEANQPLNIQFKSQASAYELQPNQTTLKVVLQGEETNGLFINKIMTLTKGSYLIDIQYVLANSSSKIWKGYMNSQLLRRSPLEDKSSPFHVGSYIGASYSNPGVHRYQKVTFKDMTKTNLEATVDGGWIAMQQRYFLTAWIPNVNTKNKFYTRASSDGSYIIGSVSQLITLDPEEKKSVTSRLYVGPEVAQTLKSIAPGLDLTIDYGWLWFISALLFSLMKTIYQGVGNWGWSIVLVTAFVKLAFYRLSATSYRSMAGMRKLQPKMQALRDRYGDDKAKISQATMELYRQEKVNPLAGCLPLIVQIPVMIALYWVLAESVELRQAPFVLWITDLTLPDPWHVLPLLMGLTMFIQQKLNPAPPDPMQAKVMMFLPVLFTGLFWSFPSGLVLYWTVSNTLTILQQWHITRKYSEDKTSKPTKRKALVNSKG